MKVTYWVFLFLVMGMFLGLIPHANAGEKVSGTVVSLEKEFLTLEEDETGEMVRVHFDKRTRITGKLEEGAAVEIELDQEHAVSIEVYGSEEGEMEEGMTDEF